MKSEVDFNAKFAHWEDSDKWMGKFDIEWLIVKDVPNRILKHLRFIVEGQEKPVTNSRDAQEIPSKQGQNMFNLIREHEQTSSLFDEFERYDQREQHKKENFRTRTEKEHPRISYKFSPTRGKRGKRIVQPRGEIASQGIPGNVVPMTVPPKVMENPATQQI